MDWCRGKIKVLKEKLKSQYEPPPDNLETAVEYKERWMSIYIVYFTMFLISLGFSIIVTGVWPYLDKLDPTAGKEFMGYVVAANPFGQMLFSPIVGWWSNRLGSIRIPLIVSLAVFTISTGLYSSIELFHQYRKYWMLVTRLVVGISSANVAACRSYLSAATRVSERTKAISMISLAQVLGFIVGPAIQAVVVPLGNDGVWLIKDRLKLDMYTASGWINVLLAVINMFMFCPSLFKEHKIAEKEAMLKQGKINPKDTYSFQKPNYIVVWTLIVNFFVLVFNFMLLETLATPLIMDQFAWSKSDSLKYMGILMSVGAVIAIATAVSIPYFSKKYTEVNTMIWGGFLFMVLGRALYIPFNHDPPVMYDSEVKLNLTFICDTLKERPSLTNIYLNTTDLAYLNQTIWTENILNETALKEMTYDCGEELLGCPSDQTWCSTIPALTVTQFVIGYLLTAFGYPVAVTLVQTLFSKILGARPQGVWMGFLTGSGCFSRVMGPVFVTYIYKRHGTIMTFGLTTAMMIMSFVWLLYFRKHMMVPEVDNQEEGEELKVISTEKTAE